MNPEVRGMNGHTKRNRRRNYKGGGSIAEFGPAIGVVLICFFFPVVNLLSLAIDYGMVMVLNINQVHEASLIPQADACDAGGAVCKNIPDQWLNGMGRFVKISGYPETKVTYRQGETDPNQETDWTVTVQTTVVCTPFLPVPLPCLNIPGLNGPVTFTISADRPVENPDYGN